MEIRDRRLIGFVIRVGLLVKGRSSQFFTFPRFSLSLSISLFGNRFDSENPRSVFVIRL